MTSHNSFIKNLKKHKLNAFISVFFLFIISACNDDEPRQAIVYNAPSSEELTDSSGVDALFVENDEQSQQIIEFIQLAEDAESDGRLILPELDNAFSYFQQALSVDKYNLDAHQGKRRVLGSIKERMSKEVENNEFAKAHAQARALLDIDPLNTSVQQLSNELVFAINKKIGKGGQSVDELNQLNAILGDLGDEFAISEEALSELSDEQKYLARIDQAIKAGRVTPPKAGNAFTLLSDARQTGNITPANVVDRAEKLSSVIYSQGTKAIVAEQLAKAKNLLGYLKKLNVSQKDIANLQQSIEIQEQRAKLASKNNVPSDASSETRSTKPKPALLEIIPAKVSKRVNPRYPRRALERGVQGWVELGAKIDASGKISDVVVLNSEPGKTFDSAASNALKRWQFVPAFDPNKNQPVESDFSVKLSFKLGN